MPSSGMLRRMALVRIHVSEECIAFIRVARIVAVGMLAVISIRSKLRRNSIVLRFVVTANVVPSSKILVTMIMEAIRSSETPVLT
jgi:hypothetical protein